MSVIRKANSFIKDLLLVSRAGILLTPFRFAFKFLYNFSMLSSWVNRHSGKIPYTDFYNPFRSYDNRVKRHEEGIKSQGLAGKPIQALEFGGGGCSSVQR